MFGLHKRPPAYQCIIFKKQINQDIKRRSSKYKDSTVHKTEYRSKRNPSRIWFQNGTTKFEDVIAINMLQVLLI